MIGRPSRRLRLDAAKAEFAQIKLIDKDINRPNRIVLAQIFIQPLGKQRALAAVIANDKTHHPILRAKSQENRIIDAVFTQPGSDSEVRTSPRHVRFFPGKRTSL
jgi:hypothetical protein